MYEFSQSVIQSLDDYVIVHGNVSRACKQKKIKYRIQDV